MSTCMVALTILLTVIAAVMLGVYLGFRAVTAILYFMGNRPEPLPQTAVMVIGEAHGGD